MSNVSTRILDFNYVFQDNVVLSASTSNTNFPVSNLADPRRTRVWRSNGVAAAGESVVIDLQSAEEIDSFAIVFDPASGIKYSETAVIRLQANATNSWATPAVNVVVTPDDERQVLTHFFTSAEEYRYWRVLIVDVGNPYGYIEIPKILLCKATVLAQNPEIGWTYSVDDDSRVTRTPYGQEYVDNYNIKRGFKFNFKAMSFDDFEDLLQIYERLGNAGHLAICLDTTSLMFDKDRFFLYGKFKGTFPVKHVVFSYFNAEFGIEETF